MVIFKIWSVKGCLRISVGTTFKVGWVIHLFQHIGGKNPNPALILQST